MKVRSRTQSTWAQVIPSARQSALLLTGDEAVAARVAQKVFVRLRATWRDLGGRDIPPAIITGITLDLLRPRPWRRQVVTPGLEGIPFRRRAASLLVEEGRLGIDEVADALRTSPAAVRGSHRATMQVDGERVRAWVRALPPSEGPAPEGRTAQSRASWGRGAVGALIVVMISGAAVAGISMARNLTDYENPRADAGPVPSPEPNSDPAEPRSAGLPAWCPDLGPALAIEADAGPAAGAIAVRFNVGLALGYRTTTERLSVRPSSAPPPHRWPGPTAAAAGRVVDSRSSAADPSLELACGPEAAQLTWRIIIETAGSSEEPVAYYLLRTEEGLRVWGSAVDGPGGAAEGG